VLSPLVGSVVNFTPRAINALRERGIWVVGTARFRVGWPPEKLRAVNQIEVDFNDFYFCYDKFGTLVAGWMDNGLAFCVSTIHKVGETVKRLRKKNEENK